MKRFLSAVMLLWGVMVYGALSVEHSGAKPGVWTTDYQAAMAAAKSHQGSVFMMFTGSDWCGWCKLMDKEVFSKPEWPAFASKQGLYLVFVDFPRDKSKMSKELQAQNSDLQQKYRVQGYPTMLLLDGEGEVFGSLSASRNVSVGGFIRETRQALFFSPKNVARIYKSLPEKAVREIKAAEQMEIRKILIAGALLDQRFPADGKEYRKIWNGMMARQKAMMAKVKQAQEAARKSGKELDWNAMQEDFQKFEAFMGGSLKKLRKLSEKVIR